ncbi:hypothetical protein JTB14_003558 [Gonioctena quinquepunctata]|nr:hypothetical protein JTB14_003558 [Gonioctena quinquepunctata]
MRSTASSSINSSCPDCSCRFEFDCNDKAEPNKKKIQQLDPRQILETAQHSSDSAKIKILVHPVVEQSNHVVNRRNYREKCCFITAKRSRPTDIFASTDCSTRPISR